MLVCVKAPSDPTAIDKTPLYKNKLSNSKLTPKIFRLHNLIMTQKIANLGTIAKKLVMPVGEPSYTSGTHKWKGAPPTIRISPENMKKKPN